MRVVYEEEGNLLIKSPGANKSQCKHTKIAMKLCSTEDESNNIQMLSLQGHWLTLCLDT